MLIDLGRYWNFWHTLSPAYFNPSSVMFEVAACISLYIVVLWIEFFPTFLEWLGRHGLQKAFNRILFFFIGLGVLLPSMHQSSLGSLLVVMGYQVHPLWQTQLLPLLFLLTAICMGYAVVILEATLAAVGFGRDIFDDLHAAVEDRQDHRGDPVRSSWSCASAIWLGAASCHGSSSSGMLSVDVLDRDRAVRLPCDRAFIQFASAAGCRSCSLPRPACWPAPCSTVSTPSWSPTNTTQHWHYFPSAPEILVTLGVIAIEVLAYVFFVKNFPILPGQPAGRVR